MTILERRTHVSGAFDKRHPDPRENYGVHGCEIHFAVVGPRGATTFTVFTPMHLPHVAGELWENSRHSQYNPFEPMGADIGYHSKTPTYEGQEVSQMRCDFCDGAPCYYDGSGLAAMEFMPEFLAGGSDAVWPMLEERYREQFGEE